MSWKKTAKPLPQFLLNKKNLGRRWFLRKSHKQQKILPPNKQVSHSKKPFTFHKLLVGRDPSFMVYDIIPTWLGSISSPFFALNNQGPGPFFRFVKPRTHKPSIKEIPDTSLLWRLPSDAKLVRTPNWGDFFFFQPLATCGVVPAGNGHFF